MIEALQERLVERVLEERLTLDDIASRRELVSDIAGVPQSSLLPNPEAVRPMAVAEQLADMGFAGISCYQSRNNVCLLFDVLSWSHHNSMYNRILRAATETRLAAPQTLTTRPILIALAQPELENHSSFFDESLAPSILKGSHHDGIFCTISGVCSSTPADRLRIASSVTIGGELIWTRTSHENGRAVPHDFMQLARVRGQRFLEQGYTVTYGDLKHSPRAGGRGRIESGVPLYACKGNHVIILFECAGYERLVAKLLAQAIESMDPPAAAENVDRTAVEQARLLLEVADGLAGSIAATMASVREREEAVQRFQHEADQVRVRYGELIRSVQDGTDELIGLSERRVALGVERYTSFSTIADQIREIRAVDTASVDTRAQVIKFKTYPYIMRVDTDCFVKIDPVSFTIQASRDQFREDHVDVECRWHPHVSESGDSVCYGTAAFRLGESWARRDWLSVAHILLAWVTQYNARDPYQRPDPRQYLPEVTRPHWVVPGGPVTITETAATESESANVLV